MAAEAERTTARVAIPVAFASSVPAQLSRPSFLVARRIVDIRYGDEGAFA
jgi:hypothetical protein